MTSTVSHDTFTIERTYNAVPARVFAALSQYDAMKRWFAGPPELGQEKIELDFRVGGSMKASGGPKGGPLHRFESRYWDIVENERIVYSYEMHLDGKRISVSLATFMLHPIGNGTRLVLTEQAAFLDGHDDVRARERGTHGLLDNLRREVER